MNANLREELVNIVVAEIAEGRITPFDPDTPPWSAADAETIAEQIVQGITEELSKRKGRASA